MTHRPSLISRREVRGWFGTAALSPHTLAAQEAKLEFGGLDHIEFYVSDPEKSSDFFVDLDGSLIQVMDPR